MAAMNSLMNDHHHLVLLQGREPPIRINIAFARVSQISSLTDAYQLLPICLYNLMVNSLQNSKHLQQNFAL